MGIVEHRAEVTGQMHYVDATTNNTFLTNGSPLVLSPAANRWHPQTGVGNGGTIISSADANVEHATNLMTQVTLPGPGTYDLWVDFWGTATTNADWRIQAGLNANSLQVYRSEKCEQVQPWTQDTALVLTNSNIPTNYLYQAYVGRVAVSTNLTASVLVGDWPYVTGNTNLVGNTCRTWYDGVSYARVEPFQVQSVSSSGPSAIYARVEFAAAGNVADHADLHGPKDDFVDTSDLLDHRCDGDTRHVQSLLDDER